MFTGNMVTEAIPARVFSLYKIVTSKKEIARDVIKYLNTSLAKKEKTLKN